MPTKANVVPDGVHPAVIVHIYVVIQSVHLKYSLRYPLASRDNFLNERVVTGRPITQGLCVG